jgi:hypothetical protein
MKGMSMKPAKRKPFDIKNASVKCTAVGMNQRNVTVSCGPVVAPYAGDNCTLAMITATLSLGGNPIGSQNMASDGAGNYTARWFFMPPGRFTATLTVTWQCMHVDTATASSDCS